MGVNSRRRGSGRQKVRKSRERRKNATSVWGNRGILKKRSKSKKNPEKLKRGRGVRTLEPRHLDKGSTTYYRNEENLRINGSSKEKRKPGGTLGGGSEERGFGRYWGNCMSRKEKEVA